jgi:hypothetical protein
MATTLSVLSPARRVGHIHGTTEVSLARWERIAAVSALIAALVALPLPPISHAPEIAATLAVGAVAALGGMRWGIAVLALTDALLFASVFPVAAGSDFSPVEQTLATLACIAAIPGLLSVGRSAPHAMALLGVRRAPRTQRWMRVALCAVAIAVVATPFV